MQLEIITPDKKVYEGAVKSVQLPGTTGLFEILDMHAPIISTLTKGKIRVIDEKNNSEFFEINGGVIEMNQNKVIVLAD